MSQENPECSESLKPKVLDNSKVSGPSQYEEEEDSEVNLKTEESSKSEERGSSEVTGSPNSKERQNLKQDKNRVRSVFSFPFRENAVHVALHNILRRKQKKSTDVKKLPRRTNGKFNWANETDLIVNCIGFSVGLGNLWRFPHVAFKNGGGAFLIPYLIITFAVSVPLYNMELILGQFTGLDPLRVWLFCPLFKGLGITIVLCTVFIQIYYCVIMSYALFYTIQTFRKTLPWSGCFKWWGADNNCYQIDVVYPIFCSAITDSLSAPSEVCTNVTESSADQFWKKYVLGLSSGLDEPGNIKWDLAICLLVTWIIVCVMTISRHHAKDKVKFKTAYFTAFFPFVILTVCFFYTITRKGASNGLKTLFLPNWMSLLDLRVWSEAAQSSLYSVGLGMGALIVFGSKNEYRYNIFRCALISSIVDVFASLLSASVTFMVVGVQTEKFNLTVSNTTLSGNGLVFVTYPDAVQNMALPNLWAFAFFFMLFILATDSSIAMTETLSIGIGVLFCPTKIYRRRNVILAAAFLYLLGLSCVTNGGAFVIDILDHYGGGHAVLGTVMIEAIAFGWGYGVEQACRDVKKIQGRMPSKYTKLCWSYVAPLTLIVLFFHTISQDHLQPLHQIEYPIYGIVIGWGIVTSVLIPVPIFMVIVLYKYRKEISKSYKPAKLWKKAVRERHQNVAV